MDAKSIDQKVNIFLPKYLKPNKFNKILGISTRPAIAKFMNRLPSIWPIFKEIP
jgi:hypothetical protein